jgi:hypothetical protein
LAISTRLTAGSNVAKHHKWGPTGVNKTARKAEKPPVLCTSVMDIHIRMGISMPNTLKSCANTASTRAHNPNRDARSAPFDSDMM